MKRKIYSLSVFAMLVAQLAFSQARTVTGVVKDKNGAPLIGAVVKTEDDKVSVQTGVDGTFEIEIPQGASANLVIEYTGYANAKVITQPGKPVDFQFSELANNLGTVIVTGYGSPVSKESWTGAADAITAEKIAKFPVTDVTRALEGAAPGLQFANGGGQPGSSGAVRIRGLSSISASSAPLYVVDGAPYAGDITSLNPNDIESVSFLKDAAATSIYGARGAAGVIIITTKRGKRGSDRAQITYEARVGSVSRALADYKLINTPKDYYEIYWRGIKNRRMYVNGEDDATSSLYATNNLIADLGGYNSYRVPNDSVVLTNGLLNPNAGAVRYQDNWDKELSRPGMRNEHTLVITGASEKTDYYISFGYLKEVGYIKNTDYDRLSARTNLNAQVNSWLSAGINASFASSNYLSAPSEGSLAPGYNPFFAARAYAPIYPVYYRDSNDQKVQDPILGGYKLDWGNLRNDPSSSIGTYPAISNRNVLGAILYDRTKSKQYNFTFVPYLQFDFLDNFTFKTQLNTSLFTNADVDYANPYYGQFAEQGGYVSRSNGLTQSYTFTNTLNWRKSFNKHYVDALIGQEAYNLYGQGLSATRYGVAIPNPNAPNLGGNPVAAGSSSAENFHRISSYFTRANYGYDNTYFLSASFRMDGNSRFSPSARWGTFWSLGGAWNMKNSPFMKDVSFFDVLKLKASYGTNGNESFGGFYANQKLYTAGYANGPEAGSLFSTIGNNSLTWEKTAQFNVGIDFAILKNRISGEFNYFQKAVKDQLFNLPTAPSTGISSRPVNLLDMVNKGIELALDINVVKTDNFLWNINTNATRYTNMITKMPDGIDSVISGINMLKKGHSIQEFYLMESGVRQSDGAPIYYYYDAEGVRRDTTNADYALLRGRAFRGSAVPKLSGAFTNNITFGNFGLSFMFTYGIGGLYYDQLYQFLMSTRNPGLNFHEDMLKSWTPENPNSEIPRIQQGYVYQSSTSTRFLTDASFLNLRNINAYYDIPSKWASKIKLQGIRVFVAVDNVYMWTKRKGMDPQATFSGVPGWNYPLSRAIIGGVKINL